MRELARSGGVPKEQTAPAPNSVFDADRVRQAEKVRADMASGTRAITPWYCCHSGIIARHFCRTVGLDAGRYKHVKKTGSKSDPREEDAEDADSATNSHSVDESSEGEELGADEGFELDLI